MRTYNIIKGVFSMTQKNYFEAMIQEINTKIYEQEKVLKEMQDPLHIIEVRYRIENLKMERQTYEETLKNLL